MPLEHSSSDEARSRNIAQLIRDGYDAAQAAAISYRIQRDSRAKKGKKKTTLPGTAETTNNTES